MTRHYALRTTMCAIVACGVVVAAADLQNEALGAYIEYANGATRLFVDRVCSGRIGTSASRSAVGSSDGEVVVGPAREGGILSIPGGLVHHWIGSTFIAGVTMQDALDVSYDYGDYRSVYKPVIASTLLSRDGSSFRVRLRIKESGGGLSAVLDVTSRVQYVFVDDRRAYSIASSEEIREIRNDGSPNERSLPAGHDSGYLWRAATFNYLEARDDGVFVETEALGLSRRFPPLLGWIIEPTARRLGRSSVERSLRDFKQAVNKRARTRQQAHE